MTRELHAPERLTGRESATRIPVLDLLRGLAALAVCMYHFTHPRDGLFAASDPLRRMTWQGWLGVEVFFVISGFVIPYSMYLRSYRLRDAGGFLVRRLKRLEPPYLSCIVLILLLNALWWQMPAMQGQRQDVSIGQLAAHLGYLNSILGYLDKSWGHAWLNPVFWTLAIEFQFYLFVALVYPLLMHERLIVRSVAPLAIASAGLIASRELELLPHWLPLFAMGIVTVQSHTKQLPIPIYATLLLPIVGLSWLIVGERQTAIGLATALAIRLWATRDVPLVLKPLMFFGAISYSLYLVHVPVGGAFIDAFASSKSAHSLRYVIVAAAIAVSVGVATLFWRYIERPSQAWARASRVPDPSTTAAGKPSGPS